MEHSQNGQEPARFRIGDCVVDTRRGTITRDGHTGRLEPQLLAFLNLLLGHAGEVVSRTQMQTYVWGNRIVSDDAMRAVVKKLRTALGDDARDPRYIRTVPLQGYTLIAPVSREDPVAEPRRPRRVLQVTVAASVLVVLALLAWTLAPRGRPPTYIESLTRMQGSEVFADYHPHTRLLVFGHRASTEKPLQLYVTSLATGRVQRLTWDDANYGNAVWSPEGGQLAFTRADGQGYRNHLLRYDPATGVSGGRVLNDPALDGRYVVAWAASGTAVYLIDDPSRGGSRGISRLDLDTGRLRPVTAPSGAGVGDFYARESHDGRLLAVLRGLEGAAIALLVLDLTSGTLVTQRVLPERANRAIWAADDSAIVLSSFAGTLFEFDVTHDAFGPMLPLPTHTNAVFNDVFHRCGSGCYFLRRHNGNFLDIEEQPSPFTTPGLLAANHLDHSGADDLPRYNVAGSSIYFLSATPDGVSLNRQSGDQRPLELTRFPRHSEITSMDLAADETAVVGLLDNRVFHLRFDAPAPEFLTSDLDAARHPVWHADGRSVVFSIHESGIHRVYRHELASGTRTELAAGYVAFQPLGDGRAVAVDTALQAWLLATDANARPLESERTLLATLQSASPNRWRLVDNHFYFTHRRGADSLMTRVDVASGTSETASLAPNRFKLEFDVHPAEDRILVVQSLLADSDLVRVRWH